MNKKIIDRYDLEQEVNRLADEFVNANMRAVDSTALAMDSRIGIVYVSTDMIAVLTSKKRAVDYYNKFEYVDPSYVTTLGKWTFYSNGDHRVETALNQYFDADRS